jgi:hypothetical protein
MINRAGRMLRDTGASHNVNKIEYPSNIGPHPDKQGPEMAEVERTAARHSEQCIK